MYDLLTLRAEARFRDARRWLLIGTLALALAGVNSIPLFIGRSPAVKDSPYLQKLFDVALVVHVDLSIFVWFLAVLLMIWRLYRDDGTPKIGLPYFQKTAQWLFLGGTLLMAASPWFGGEHIKSNYIPVIGNPVFFSSLELITAAVACALLETLLARGPLRLLRAALGHKATLKDALAFGAYSSALMMLVAFACFALSARQADPSSRGVDYYESLFWAGGHVLQFVYAQAMMVAWIVIAAASGLRLPGQARYYSLLFLLNAAVTLFALLPFSQFPVAGPEFQLAYTRLMRGGNGIAPSLLGLAIFSGSIATKKRLPFGYAPFLALVASFALFLFGGLFGVAIKGENVRVPAHYHGSIVGITLAFMGMAYVLMPRLGFADPARWKWARIQPVVYCVGQLMFAGGLAYAGGYDVLRKTVGSLQDQPPGVKIAMWIFEAGATFAVLGGVLFVIVAWRAWRREKPA